MDIFQKVLEIFKLKQNIHIKKKHSDWKSLFFGKIATLVNVTVYYHVCIDGLKQ